MGCFPSNGKVQRVHVQHQPALCLARCGKPSWNGDPDEYCSVACRQKGPQSRQANATCRAPGCNKQSWNGVAGGYCSNVCRNNDTGNATHKPLCATPGCGKPTWNGQPGEYCNKNCKASAVTLCSAPGCGKPTWDGRPGFCSKSCRINSGGGGAAVCLKPGCGKPTWNGLPGEFCSNFCKGSAPANLTAGPSNYRKTTQCVLLQPGTAKYDSLKKQYEDKWDTGRCAPTAIRAIYEVYPSSRVWQQFEDRCNKIGNVKCFGHGTNPGNVQRRFHGTRLRCHPGDPWMPCTDTNCSACRIIVDDFSMVHLGGWSGNKGVYGGGIYFTSMSSTAKGYGLDKAAGFAFDKGNWMDPQAGNCVLIANIACGRVETVNGPVSHNLDLSNFESRKVDKSSGADELVVFDAAQVLVRALIVF